MMCRPRAVGTQGTHKIWFLQPRSLEGDEEGKAAGQQSVQTTWRRDWAKTRREGLGSHCKVRGSRDGETLWQPVDRTL